MPTYPTLIQTIADRDPAELAAAAGITTTELDAITAGWWAPSLTIRDRIARALGANPIDLFRLEDDLEDALAGAPTRFVTDPATLRIIDHQGPR